jgi:cytochrome c-type biogenesis protein CcmE
MTRKTRRLALIGAALAVLAVAAGLVLTALQSSITFFASPSDVVEKGIGAGQRLRLGGLVEEGSVKRPGPGTIVFGVTDTNKAITVTYSGIVPDLFREGQGVVVEGVLDPGGIFQADTLLAKHDERYMPKEVADALKAQGRWQEGSGGKASGGKPTAGGTTP